MPIPTTTTATTKAPNSSGGWLKSLSKDKIKVSSSKMDEYRLTNIKIGYVQTLVYSLYQSICMWNVFDAYISVLAKQAGSPGNTWVGATESMGGMATLIFAVPCGLAADKYDRTAICRFACIIGLCSTVLSTLGFYYDNWTLIFSSMWCWGLYASLNGTAGEAIFADSCDPGTRSNNTAKKGSLQSAGLALGPFLMYLIFEIYGNKWNVQVMHVPLLAGCFLSPLNSIPLLFMRDLRNYEEVYDSNRIPIIDMDRRNTNVEILKSRGLASEKPRLLLANFPRPRGDSVAVSQEQFRGKTVEDFDNLVNSNTTTINDKIKAEEEKFLRMDRWERSVPYLLTVADFIMEMGAGMTVRFFALFFMNEFKITPKQMSLIFGVYPLLVAIATMACQKLSLLVGRAQVSWVCQFLGIFSLLSMTIIDDLYLLIFVFFLRSAFQNGPYPVDRSILYDYIPSSGRGKWASIASLLTMTWSGSAVIGGLLIDKYDYRTTFALTASVYSLGLVIYTPLVWLVPRKEANMCI